MKSHRSRPRPHIFKRLPISRLRSLSSSALWPGGTGASSHTSEEFGEQESFFSSQAVWLQFLCLYQIVVSKSAPRLRSAELHGFIEAHAFPESSISHRMPKRRCGIFSYATVSNSYFLLIATPQKPPSTPTSDDDMILHHLLY